MAVCLFPGSKLLVLLWLLGMVDGECENIVNPLKSVKETDPAGTRAFALSATDGASWTFKIKESKHQKIREYLSFSKSGDEYVMSLIKPLDLEELHRLGIDDYLFTLSTICSQPNRPDIVNQVYEVFLTVNPVSEYPPTFNKSRIDLYVQEDRAPPVTIVNLINWASDRDHNPKRNEINYFSFLEPKNPKFDMPNPLKGTIRTKSVLDYDDLPEGRKFLEIGVKVFDSAYKSATATLIIHVMHADDLPPKFIHPECSAPCDYIYYTSVVQIDFEGTAEISPAQIKAEDQDSFGAKITYSLTQGPPGFRDYIQIDADTGDVTIRKPLSGLRVTAFVVMVKAREQSTLRLATLTTLLIAVHDGPKLRANGQPATVDDDRLITFGVVVAIILSL